MQILTAESIPVETTVAMDPSGREMLVIVAKFTFTIPPPGQVPERAEEQVPLIFADEFTGEPGLSAPIYESDFAPCKRHCDVLLVGSAYAPYGQAAERVQVELAVGDWSKRFWVVGDRTWEIGPGGIVPSRVTPFTQKPFSYDDAFGGTDKTDPNPDNQRTFPANHAGKGYHLNWDMLKIVGQPLPNTEAEGKPILDSRSSYRPMAFGPIGRAWKPRVDLAGTYDQTWRDEQFPFLPKDFNQDYFQAAPEDQWIDYPRGGEKVRLVHLTPSGMVEFSLPQLDLPVEIVLANGESEYPAAVCDTLIIEPDLGRFSMVFRAMQPLRRNVFEISAVVVGRMSRAWYRARETGKTYFPGLAAYLESRAPIEAPALVEFSGEGGSGDANGEAG